MAVVTKILLAALILGAGTALAEVKTPPEETSRATRNPKPLVAGLLGAVIGFGSGHLYAHNDWTARSTVYIPIDLVTTPVLMVSAAQMAHGEPWGYIGMLIVVPVKILEGLSAARVASRISKSMEQDAPQSEAVPEVSAYGGVSGIKPQTRTPHSLVLPIIVHRF